MERPYIDELRIQDYGPIRDATFHLTPLHALIGPNDSGKSTVLRALRTLAFLMGSPWEDSAEKKALLRAITANKPKEGPRFEVSVPSTTWHVHFNASGYRDRSASRGKQLEADVEQSPLKSFSVDPQEATSDIRQALRGAQLLRLDPDALRAPHSLIPDGQPLRFLDERGTGLPALYDALIVRNLTAYVALNQELSRLFPSVASIQLTTPTPDTRGMGVKLADGTFVPAELMSEGLLYYLAYAVLPHLEPTPLLLVEEPENGLHPARIAEVMRVLRAISEHTQVLVATHSPLVVNELQPAEVTIVTRSRDEGTKATRLKDTPGFEELHRKGVAPKDGAAMVRVVEEADLSKLPSDAVSLSRWLERASAVLPAMVARRAAGSGG